MLKLIRENLTFLLLVAVVYPVLQLIEARRNRRGKKTSVVISDGKSMHLISGHDLITTLGKKKK